MHYILYQITNKLNGKIYVGVHKTKSLDDGYMGSGKVVRRALETHGVENFEKVILETFENAEAMYAREAEVVNEEFLSRDDVYNLRRGGHGGFEFINKNKLQGFVLDVESSRKGRDTTNKFLIEKYGSLSEFSRKSGCISRDKGVGIHDPKKRKHYSDLAKIAALSEESRTKRKETFSKIGHQRGSSNSQSNTIWITDGIQNKKIRKTDEIPFGFRKGRIVKK